MEAAAVGHALHGLDLPSLAFDGQGQAGQHRLAVDQDGAGAAFPELAAVLGAREIEVFSQDLEQGLVHGHDHVPGLAIDRERQLRLHTSPPGRAVPVVIGIRKST